MDVWRCVADERVALANQLDAISPAAWDAPSLCGGWRVRDVVSHLVSLAEAKSRLGNIARHARVDLRPNRAVDKIARQIATEALPAELTNRLRAARDGRFTVPGMPPTVALGEVLVHRADIAAAAGLPQRAADDAMRAALTAELRLWFAFGVSPRMRRNLFVATDGDWTVGPTDGRRIEARGEELLLIACGRKPVV